MMIRSDKTSFLLWLNKNKLIWNFDNTATKRPEFKSDRHSMIWKCMAILPAAPPVINPHRRPLCAARSEWIIRRRRPIKLSLWKQPTSWLPFELPWPWQQLHLSVSHFGSALPQSGIVEIPAPQSDMRGLWPVALHQESSTDKDTVKIKSQRPAFCSSVSAQHLWNWLVCPTVWVHDRGQQRRGSRLCVRRVLSRALDHAVKWKVLVHDHKPSRK